MTAKQFADSLKKAEREVEEVAINGFHHFLLCSGPKKRERLTSLITNTPVTVKFEDDFPFTQDELRLRAKINSFFVQPKEDETNRNLSYVPGDQMTIEERTKRAALKKQQIAEFDPDTQRLRRRIVQLKAERLTERDIVDILKEEKLKTKNNKEILQGTVNRLYRSYLDMYDNLFPRRGLNPALLGPDDDSVDSHAHKDVTSPMKASSGLRLLGIDKDYKMLNAEEYLDLAFPLDEFPREGVFLKFYLNGAYEPLSGDLRFIDEQVEKEVNDRAPILVETLRIPLRHLDEAGKISIDIKEETLLRPGLYRVELFDEKAMSDNEPLRIYGLRIGEKFTEVPKVRMTWSNRRGQYVPGMA
ncbi:hypothetical protein [Lewinella sp. W8]|uniref:hypothetical protein n=1 Tax=Lewinella sp. W8 TaxID=2528208 RepID=UPI0010681BD1|nr:hypothetical protein [Lewinella sp. W8]MTB49750.1 hypothetical protein [Lewinella sp. W8]